MVGLVIVSHSARLAEGVAELARGMGGPDIALVATGGLDLPGRPLGTDPMLVLRAIDAAYSDDGVVVLMDLGSAVLSAEMALDLLSPERRGRVILCEGPLVEGAIAAAVQARLGSPLDQVLAAARDALAAKAAQLGEPVSAAAPPAAIDHRQASEPGHEEPCELRLNVRNQSGLHARPAAQFVRVAAQFENAKITVHNLTTDRGPVNAKSITSVLTLAVRQGHEIHLSASGASAQAALNALAALARKNFGDAESEI